MKPQIAIGLSSAGVEMLHRGRDGWRTINAVPLDDPDLAGRLRAARERGQELVRGPFVAKLIIPESEILYRTVHAPGPDDAAREAQIAAAIDGLTPYAIDDLVFDWCGIGDELQVAVVARETLAEAEAFAAEHGLDAAAFVAAPDDARFMGEVYFGRTSMAAWLVPPDETIERDAAPVVSVGPVPEAVPRPTLGGGSSPGSTAARDGSGSGAAAPVPGKETAPAPKAAAQPAPPPRGAADPADPTGEDVAATVRAAGQAATGTPAAASASVTPPSAPVQGGRRSVGSGARKQGHAGSGSGGGAGLAGGLASVLPWFARGKPGAAATSTARAALKTATDTTARAGAIGAGVIGAGTSSEGVTGNGAMPATGAAGAAPGAGPDGGTSPTGADAAPIAFSSRRRPASALAGGSGPAATPSDGSGVAAPARMGAGAESGAKASGAKASGAKAGRSGLRSLGARLEQMRARLTGGDRRRAATGAAATGAAQTRPDAGATVSGTAGTGAAGTATGGTDAPLAADAARSDTLSTKARALLKRSGRDRPDAAPTGRAGAGKDSGKERSGDAGKGPGAQRVKGATATLTAGAAPSKPESKPELKQALAAPVPDLTARGGRKSLTAEAAGTEAEKLTIFGARGNPPAERGFLSRGLMLTGGLVLFLIAVAVWAVYFTSSPDPQTGIPAPAETGPPPVAALPGAEAPADAAGLTDPEALPAFDEQAQIDATIAGIEEALAEAADPVAEPAEPVPAEPAASAPEDSAGPGPALAADPASDPGPLAAPSAATTRDASDALRTEGGGVTDAPFALSGLTPPSGSAAVLPEPPPAPAPFGTEPVPGAASSPDFEPPPEVIQGRPAAVPPPRPAGLAPQDDAQAPLPAPDAPDAPTAPATMTAQAAAPAAPAPGAAVDPAPESADMEIAAITEAGAAPAALTEAQAAAQGIALFTEADPALAALRPQARPETEATAVSAAPPPAEDTAAAAPADAPTEGPAATAAMAAPDRASLTGPHSDAEAAAQAQGLALFSVADPDLAALRPETRPETVLAAAVARATPPETDQAADQAARQAPVAAAGASDTATPPATDADSAVTASPGGLVLTALRPAARPESLIARPAGQTTAPEADTAEVTSDSPYAVALSLRPSQRPQDFSRRVQQTMAAVQQRQQQAPAAQQQAAPVQQASAPARTATPQIPTSASVAREATQTRAINLRQLNLLGTFGTRSNRTALVRLSNGRVQQVRVGDRLDRGQVTAIGESELTYVRSGRSHRLRVAERG
ncbi:MAG: pilus assembly protein PilP [Rhodobacteraceae bacterium]|nr:pilus assembly protein PilP [Paracoccaceae bacterium]